MSIAVSPDRVAGEVAQSRKPARPLDCALVAVLAVAASAAGASRPSLWFDEAATISASTRTVPQLWRLLGNIDAVHGLYYLIMHGWFAVFPATEFWSRLPSALAVGGAAAGVVVLGNQLSSRSVAVTAGIVFAILPRTTWAGIEARSYALSMVAAVWLTVLCVAAARRSRPSLWLLYAVLLTASTVLNVFVVLLVPVHAVVVATVSGTGKTVLRWAIAATATVAAVTPFLLFSQTQIAQVRWISPLSPGTITEIAREQYFDHAVPFAVLAALTIVAAAVTRSRAPGPGEDSPRCLVIITVAWLVLPTILLLIYSACSNPIYYPRYLSFSTPAMALLLGVCVVAAGKTRARIATILVALAIAAAPNYLVEQRGPYSKEGMDFSQVADVITRHAAAGDCLILDNTTTWKPGPIRPLVSARPLAYAKLIDPGRGRRAAERNTLWDAHIAIWAWRDRMRSCPALWTVSEYDKTRPAHESGPVLPPGPRLGRAPAYQVPSTMGFHVVERWQFSFAQVTKSTR